MISNIHISDYETLMAASRAKSSYEVQLESGKVPLVDHYLEGDSNLAALWAHRATWKSRNPGATQVGKSAFTRKSRCGGERENSHDSQNRVQMEQGRYPSLLS